MVPAIRIENLSKQFRIGAQRVPYHTLRETVARTLGTPIRRFRDVLSGKPTASADPYRTFWALKSITFDIQPGEIVGIIGRNGAGKSTLLKILSRITEPSEGTVQLIGRVGALLEVGTGFHSELTGRENVFLNGSILGMSRAEIARKFDEIIDFAGIDRFVDTPIKYYSSGMGLRLGFSVAAFLEPEILIVDEVLAVGDAKFQKKCIGKMSEVAGEGRTVLFVSHNMTAIQSLCQRVVWLDAGHVTEDGPTEQVVGHYLRAALSSDLRLVWEDQASAPGNDSVRLHSVSVRAADGEADTQITCQSPITIHFEYWNQIAGSFLRLSAVIKSQDGAIVFATRSITDPNWHGKGFVMGLFSSEFRIPGGLLNDGTYYVAIRLLKDETVMLYADENIIAFDVVDLGEADGQWVGKRAGVIRVNLPWETRLMEETNH